MHTRRGRAFAAFSLKFQFSSIQQFTLRHMHNETVDAIKATNSDRKCARINLSNCTHAEEKRKT